MASAEINCEKENIERDSATVSGRCSGFTASPNDPEPEPDWYPPESDGVLSQSRSQSEIRYKITRYEWIFTPGGTIDGDSNGNVSNFIISGLEAGTEKSITATINCYQTGEVYTRSASRSRTYDEETKKYSGWSGGGWSSYTYSYPQAEELLGSASAEKTIYTKPEEFSWNGSVGKDKTIQTPEFSAAWNKLIETAGKRQNYENQKGGNDYSSYNAESNALITAAGYNAIAKACNVNKIVNQGDIIYASLYEDLATSINNYPW